jgi:hypothetical protein
LSSLAKKLPKNCQKIAKKLPKNCQKIAKKVKKKFPRFFTAHFTSIKTVLLNAVLFSQSHEGPSRI